MNPTTANYDEPWKEALSEYFEAFLYFFFPEVHQLIDWTKIPESLEKELKRITASAKTNKFTGSNDTNISNTSNRLVVMTTHRT